MSDENRLGELLWGRQGGIWVLVSGISVVASKVKHREQWQEGDERRSEEYGNEPLSKVGIAVVESASRAGIAVVDVELDDGDDGQEGRKMGVGKKEVDVSRPRQMRKAPPGERKNRRADIKTGTVHVYPSGSGA
ncbi:hypothetical protein BKA70DRAFT_1233812 [Coprinopsis sp. MPI-PUGE-AT-0042]|nr:hypothetical protein BKA70DRAFT_1233812 [Coprinopsis sp. MPI-PUGE-AT-0042]